MNFVIRRYRRHNFANIDILFKNIEKSARLRTLCNNLCLLIIVLIWFIFIINLVTPVFPN